MKIIFMGTPDFAVPSLRALVEAGYDVAGVVTATDKWGGRGNKTLLESAVKKYAQSQGLHILQPKNLKALSFQEELRALQADLQVVVAFRMLPEAVWAMPPLGTMNLHGSLLPKYRGAAPIHWAVIHGETETGVTTFLLRHEIDTGDILMQQSIPIGPDETTGEVHDRMMKMGAAVVLESVRKIASGNYSPIPQDHHQATKAPKIFTETCEIDFHQNTLEVYNFIRGLSPYPAAWTRLEGKILKIYEARPEKALHQIQPGSFITDQRNYLKYATQDGFIQVFSLQLQGKKRMNIHDFLNGYSFKA